MADTRTYIRVHDGMPDHPKVDGLSDGAFRLLITMWCWCSRHLTDGHIPTATWSKRGTPKARRELVTAGLAVVTDGGVQMHDYLEHQRSSDEVEELRRKRQEAGRKGGNAKAKNLASAKQPPQQTPSKPVPESESDTETELLNSSQSVVSPDVPRDPKPDDDRPEIDYDDLAARLRPLLGPVDTTWARRVADRILPLAKGDVRNPTSYVLRAVHEDPGPYRPTGQPPPPTRDVPPEDVVASEDARDRLAAARTAIRGATA